MTDEPAGWRIEISAAAEVVPGDPPEPESPDSDETEDVTQ